MKNQNIAIIGAGTAGLAAAALLAAQGHQICIFEKSQNWIPLALDYYYSQPVLLFLNI